ncbi:hypothetical protein XENTR_v10022312 [Xenopus tropicalis]|nr:hypothetical protein XENTR_v10022312 [Xenopus tropicalis]
MNHLGDMVQHLESAPQEGNGNYTQGSRFICNPHFPQCPACTSDGSTPIVPAINITEQSCICRPSSCLSMHLNTYSATPKLLSVSL